VNDYPIHLGSSLFTLVDPEPGHEVEYNRWYERDHFYAGCMIGPWLFAGRRWVATRALKDLRFPADGDAVASPVAKGSYLATYWVLDGKRDEHFGWAGPQAVELYKQNRGFHQRTHAHTVLLDHPTFAYRDDDPVPVELALDHPYAGLAVVAVDPAHGVTDEALQAHLERDALPALFNDSPIASMVSWSYVQMGKGTENAPMDLGMPPGPPERRLQMFFLDAAPDTVWDRFRGYADALTASGMGAVRFAAPFVPTIVGTDTYTDQLW